MRHTKWRHAQSETKRRARWLWATYRLTSGQYEELREAQGDACKLCRKSFSTPKTIHVDHKHGTTIVRGLLCHKCNLGLGHFEDNADVLRRAAEYVDTVAIDNSPNRNAVPRHLRVQQERLHARKYTFLAAVRKMSDDHVKAQTIGRVRDLVRSGMNIRQAGEVVGSDHAYGTLCRWMREPTPIHVEDIGYGC